MKLIYDASSTLLPLSGVGRYTLELLKALIAEWPSDFPAPTVWFNSLRRRPVNPRHAALRWAARKNQIEAIRTRIPGPVLLNAWKWLGWPGVEWMAGKGDVVHCPASYVAPVRNAARVVTIHDLHFLRHPAHGERMGGGYLASTLHRKLPTVEGIIVPSNAVREEVLAHFTQLHRDQVFIVPEGVDPRRFRPVGLGRIQQTLQKRGVTGRYILAVSTLEPRKNMARLFRAVSQWVKAADRADEVPRLMVVGKRGWGGVTIDELCTQSKLDRNRVTWLDDVADHELVGLYGGAEFVVMPSLWEGFGLPILEAMACGRPVIGSNQGALPEVVGDAGILIDPLDEINLSRVMIDLYHAPEERKADLGEMALKRAKSFSWKAAAQGTLQVYREAAAIREARRK